MSLKSPSPPFPNHLSQACCCSDWEGGGDKHKYKRQTAVTWLSYLPNKGPYFSCACWASLKISSFKPTHFIPSFHFMFFIVVCLEAAPFMCILSKKVEQYSVLKCMRTLSLIHYKLYFSIWRHCTNIGIVQ